LKMGSWWVPEPKTQMCAHGKGAGSGDHGDPRPETLVTLETLYPGKGIWWRTAVYIPYTCSITYRVPRALGSIYAWYGDFRYLE
jgi:hypothetical protein